jgi:PhnB protein
MTTKVKPVPEGYHSVTPYLNAKGAMALLDFLKKGLGAEEMVKMPGPNGTLMHAEVRIGDSMVMLSDPMRDAATISALVVYVPDCDATFKRAVDAGAKAIEQPSLMPWGDRMGRIEDPAGNRWSIGTHVEDVPPAEMEARMKKMAEQQKQ